MKNIGLKIFSLITAIGLSYYVNSENNSSTMRFNVPIEIKNLPDDKVLLSSLSSGVQVTIKGPSHLARQVIGSNPTFKVRLPPEAPERYIARLREVDLALPDSVQVLSISPSEIEINLEEKITKSGVTVTVPKQGKLEDGLLLSSLTISPEEVTITGPAAEVNRIDKIESEPLLMWEVKRSGSVVLPLRSPGELTTLDKESIRVDLRLSHIQGDHVLQGVVVELRSTSGDSYAITPRTVDIEFTGSKKAIRDLTPESVVPYVRLRPGLSNGDSVVVGVDLPRGISLIDVRPSEVKISGVITPAS